jgi:hypothetical protein
MVLQIYVPLSFASHPSTPSDAVLLGNPATLPILDYICLKLDVVSTREIAMLTGQCFGGGLRCIRSQLVGHLQLNLHFPGHLVSAPHVLHEYLPPRLSS